MSLPNRFVNFNGELVKSVDVELTLSNQAFNYGTGVFEGIRAYKNHNENGATLNLFRLESHYERFIRSAKSLKMDLGWNVQQFCEATVNLIRANKFNCDCYIRPMAFKSSLQPGVPFGVKLTGVDHNFSINALPMGKYVKTRGIHCGVSKWKRTPNESFPSHAKITGGYVNNALAMESAISRGFDDAILLDYDGYITEATTANLFIVKNGQIFTPKSGNILPGITRSSVITLAKQELNIDVMEKDLTLNDLLSADECFMTGTGVEITPVLSVEASSFGEGVSGLITNQLKARYDDIVRGNNSTYRDWLYAVV